MLPVSVMDSLALSTPLPRYSRLWLRLGLGVLIGGAALWWAMRGLSLAAVLQSLQEVSPLWTAGSVIGVIAVTLAKAARWIALYGGRASQISFRQSFTILAAAQMVNVVIPVRVGELMRIGLMKQAGQPASLTLSTILVEKTLDLLVTGLAAALLVSLTAAPVWLEERVGGVVLLGLLASAGLFLIWRLRRGVGSLDHWPLFSRRWQRWLLERFNLMSNSLETLTQWRSLVITLGWTTCIWLLSLLTIVTLFAAFRLKVPATAAIVMMLAVNSSNIIPAPPALVGVMHLIAVVVLGQYGVAPPPAMSFGIVLNLVTVAPLIILGSWALWSVGGGPWPPVPCDSLTIKNQGQMTNDKPDQSPVS